MEETANAATFMIIILLLLVFAVFIINIKYQPVKKTNDAFGDARAAEITTGE